MLRWLRAAIALIFLMLATVPAHADKRVALVIGNGAYQHAGTLANPKNDANDISAALKKLNYQVVEGFDLNKNALDLKLREFSRALEGADVAVFFYAGHGLQVKGTNFLVATDAKLEAERDLDFETLRVEVVLAHMEREAKTNIVFLDACRNNPLARNLARTMGTRGVSENNGLAPVASALGTFIAFATQPGAVASDGTGRNSPFSAALKRYIAESGMSVTDLMIEVRKEVVGASKGSQVPWDHSALQGRFYFAAAAQAAAPVTLAPPSAQPRLSEAAEAWDRTKDMQSVPALDAFMRRFGDTYYGDLAKMRLAELKQVEAAKQAADTAKKKADDEARAKADAERLRLAMLKQEEGDAARKKADEEALRVKTETERQRLALHEEGRKALEAANLAKPVEVMKPGQVFRDCRECPQMVVLPAGSFMMGSAASDQDRGYTEGPQHKVTMARPFAVGTFEVTFAEWDGCLVAGGCRYRPEDSGWGRGNRPVINVSWEDAKQYARWVSTVTGKNYRLLTEAEWEYAARAGTSTSYSWGKEVGHNRANCTGCGSQWDNKQTAPVGTFPANAFGLHEMHGNVWEWVEDCWHGSYQGAPSDGSAWTMSCTQNSRVLRGGSWGFNPQNLRAANRSWNSPIYRDNYYGFRVARTLD